MKPVLSFVCRLGESRGGYQGRRTRCRLGAPFFQRRRGVPHGDFRT